MSANMLTPAPTHLLGSTITQTYFEPELNVCILLKPNITPSKILDGVKIKPLYGRTNALLSLS